MKLISLVASACTAHRHTALIGPHATYRDDAIRGAVALTIQHWQACGVEPGQRILLIADHDEQALFALAAASALGVQVVMPYSLQEAIAEEWKAMFALIQPDHVMYCRADLSVAETLTRAALAPNVWRIDPQQAEAAKDLPLMIVSPDPVAHFLMLFSSGTTGAPKAISIPETLICRRIASVSSTLSFTEDAHILQAGLMNNTTGIIFSFGTLLHGATLFYPPTRNVADWPAFCAQQDITHAMLRPVALQQFMDGMARDGITLPHMRVLAYGAAAMPPTLLSEGRKTLPCQWVQGYGLSETFGPFCWLNEAAHQHLAHDPTAYCIGTPDDTLCVAIRTDNDGVIPLTPGAEGEIVLRGDGMMAGYFKPDLLSMHPMPEWFPTGDYARIGQDGEVLLKGRISQSLLTANGHRIYPEEVENVLTTVPGVREAVLIGQPIDSGYGDIPVACVFPEDPTIASGALLDSLCDTLRGALSQEKWPLLGYVSRTPFPRSANGKIIRRQVAEALAIHALTPLDIAEKNNHETV